MTRRPHVRLLARGSTFACTLDGPARTAPTVTLALAGLDAGTYEVAATATSADGRPTRRRWSRGSRSRSTTGSWTGRGAPGASVSDRAVPRHRVGLDLASRRPVDPGERCAAILLVADRTPLSGSVSVYLGRSILRTVSLRGPLEQAAVIRIGRAVGGPIAGRIRVVAENGRAIRVDGLAVISAP